MFALGIKAAVLLYLRTLDPIFRGLKLNEVSVVLPDSCRDSEHLTRFLGD